MKKVILHGKLGKRFGESHLLAVKTPADCIGALDVLLDGFRMHLIEAAKAGTVYGIKNEKEEFIKCEEYNFINKSESLHFVPIPQGGLGAIVSIAATTYLGLWLSDLFQVDPVKEGKSVKSESYLYNGATTATKQGIPVPIGYGRLRVGPTIISNNILNYDYDIDRGVIMGFDKGNTDELFVGSSSYSFAPIKNEEDAFVGQRGSLGGLIYNGDPSNLNSLWEFQDADGSRLSASRGITTQGVGMVPVNNTASPLPGIAADTVGNGPWIDNMIGNMNVSSMPSAPSAACVTQTFPLNKDGTVNLGFSPTNPRFISVSEDSTRKFRNLDGTTIVVGPRYINGENSNDGLGWTALSSTSVKKIVGVICEGVIGGLVDANGDRKEYDWKSATNEKIEYMKGVYINDVPVMNTADNNFNIPKIDFDLGTTSEKVIIEKSCSIGGGSEYLIGSNDQRLLRPEYLYAGNTYAKNAILYGPRVDAGSPGNLYMEAKTESFPRPEEENFSSHIITNPNIEFAIVSIKINELFYVYEGDESRVTIKLGSLLGALIGALLGWMWTDKGSNNVSLSTAFTALSTAATARAAAFKASSSTAPALGTAGTTSEPALATAMGLAATKYTTDTALTAALKVLAGAAIGAIIGNNLNLYSGRKIDNSGETWPNIIKFRVKTSNLGDESAEYVTDIKVHGVATEPYVKDFIIPLPKDNPNNSNRLLKIYRTTRQKNSIREGEVAARYRESAELLSITEVFTVKQNYPNTVVFGARINARDVPQQRSDFSFDLKLKKVKIPSNYNPLTRVYEGIWNGLFRGEESFGDSVKEADLMWTDNPAWCFHDLLENKVYGLGKFGIEEDNIDRWTLYKIAKFCDELVPTGFSPKYPKRSFETLEGDVPGNIIKITEAMTEQEFKMEFLGLSEASIIALPSASNNVNVGKNLSIFYGDGTGENIPITRIDLAAKKIELRRSTSRSGGTAVVEHLYPLLEPRFTCNAFINTREGAYELIKKMAKIFRGTTYWAEGSIFLYQEQKKDAIALFTNNNVGERGFSYSSSARTQRYNSCTIQYVDKNNSFKPRTEYAEDREGIIKNSLIEVNVDGFGITSKGQATRAALYTIDGAKLDNEMIEFKTDVIGSYLRPGDVFNVIDTNRTIAKCEGKVIEVYPLSGKGNAPRIKVDYPLKQLIKAEDPNSWMSINLYTPSKNKRIADLKNDSTITDHDINQLRESQISQFYITGISDNDRMLHLQYNPFSFVSGDYTATEAKEEANANNGKLAEIYNQRDRDLFNRSLPSGENAWIGARAIEQPSVKFVWGSNEETVNYNNWYNSTVPSPTFSAQNSIMYAKATGSGVAPDFGTWGLNKNTDRAGYMFQNNGLNAIKLTEGTSYIIESITNLAKPRQYRTTNVSEDSPGVFKINGIKYNKSKYGNIEENISITMPEVPPIHIVTPGDPTSLTLSQGSTANTLEAEWDIVTGALGYKLDLYRDDGIVKSFQIPQDYSVATMTKTIDTLGVIGNYSAKVYSTI